MVGGVAQEQLRALGALEVQVRVVLPREADATVDLNVLRGAVEERLGAEGFGERRGDGQLVIELLSGPGGVVRGGLGRLDVEQHVGALVLDGLERSDRSAELHTMLGVVNRVVEHTLSPTHLLGGQC